MCVCVHVLHSPFEFVIPLTYRTAAKLQQGQFKIFLGTLIAGGEITFTGLLLFFSFLSHRRAVLASAARRGAAAEGVRARGGPRTPSALWGSRTVCLHHRGHADSFEQPRPFFLTFLDLFLTLE